VRPVTFFNLLCPSCICVKATIYSKNVKKVLLFDSEMKLIEFYFFLKTLLFFKNYNLYSHWDNFRIEKGKLIILKNTKCQNLPSIELDQSIFFSPFFPSHHSVNASKVPYLVCLTIDHLSGVKSWRNPSLKSVRCLGLCQPCQNCFCLLAKIVL
jgi:hypothetical protein